MKLRAALLEDAVVPEAAFFQHVGGALEVCGDIVRVVGVRAYGDDLPAQLPIPLQRAHAGVEIPHSVLQAAGVQLDAFPLVQQKLQNLVQDVPIELIGISPVLFRRVADHIIQMPVHVEIGEFPDVLQRVLKIFPDGFPGVPPLEKAGIIGILPRQMWVEPITKSKS